MEKEYLTLHDLNKDSEIISETSFGYFTSTKPTNNTASKLQSMTRLFTVKFRTSKKISRTLKFTKTKSDDKMIIIEVLNEEENASKIVRSRSVDFSPAYKIRAKKETIKAEKLTLTYEPDMKSKHLVHDINKALTRKDYILELSKDLPFMSVEDLEAVVHSLNWPNCFYVAPRLCFALLPVISLSSVTLITKRLYSYLTKLACDEVGADFLVELLSKLTIRKKQQKVMTLLSPYLGQLIKNGNGAKVIVCLIENFPLRLTEKIVSYIFTHLFAILNMSHGVELFVSVVPHVYRKNEQQKFTKKIVERSEKLYELKRAITIIDSLFVHWKEESEERIANAVLDDFDYLANITNGSEIVSYVIERMPKVNV